MSILILTFTVLLLAGLGWTALDAYRLRRGSDRGRVARLVIGLGRAVADLWRETDDANRRVIELQQPWREHIR